MQKSILVCFYAPQYVLGSKRHVAMSTTCVHHIPSRA